MIARASQVELVLDLQVDGRRRWDRKKECEAVARGQRQGTATFEGLCKAAEAEPGKWSAYQTEKLLPLTGDWLQDGSLLPLQ